jgi:hypothetical protein
MTELVNLSQATVLKAGDTFCVSERDGSLPLDTDHPLGLYHEDCRHLRGYELRLAGRPLRCTPPMRRGTRRSSSSPTRTSGSPASGGCRCSPLRGSR